MSVLAWILLNLLLLKLLLLKTNQLNAKCCYVFSFFVVRIIDMKNSSCVPYGTSWRTPRGTRTTSWKPMEWRVTTYKNVPGALLLVLRYPQCFISMWLASMTLDTIWLTSTTLIFIWLTFTTLTFIRFTSVTLTIIWHTSTTLTIIWFDCTILNITWCPLQSWTLCDCLP